MFLVLTFDGMSEYIHKSHNVTVLMYHIVLPAKYRRVIFDEEVDEVLKDVCKRITEIDSEKIRIGAKKRHM